MATTAPQPTSNSTPTAPPDEAFWVKYSPHHEAPVSGVSSTALHGLVVGVAVLVFWADSKINPNDEKEPPKPQQKVPVPLQAVVFDGDGKQPGGSGGRRDGKSDGTNSLFNPDLKEKGSGGKDPVNVGTQQVQRVKLSPRQAAAARAEFGQDFPKHVARGPEMGKLLDLEKGLREQLRRGVNPGLGKGSAGTGGGQDDGDGKGVGPGVGDGDGKGGKGRMLNEREERMLRWSMTFRTNNGSHYAAQLRDLEAILAVPASNEQYVVYRDFEPGRRATGAIEDVTKLNRIFWIDDKRQSVSSLSRALGWPPTTNLFVAFFPEKLEKKLFKIEMEYAARKNGGRKVNENTIDQTYFDVVLGAGGYDVEVRDVIFK